MFVRLFWINASESLEKNQQELFTKKKKTEKRSEKELFTT